MKARVGPASKLALPSIWRRYHWPLDSPTMSVLVNFSAPSGKCPHQFARCWSSAIYLAVGGM